MRLLTALSAAAAAIALSSAAHAGVTVLSTSGVDAVPAGYDLIATFDGSGLGTTDTGFVAPGYAYSGTTFNTGTNPNVAAMPVGDATRYAYVLGGATTTLTTSNLLTGLSLYVGSIDAYNSISFYGPGNTLVGTITGSDIMPSPDGNQGAGGSKYVNFGFSSYVDKIVFASSGNSLEFDDVSVSAAPEPGIWALMLGGIGLLGGMLRVASARRREQDADAGLLA